MYYEFKSDFRSHNTHRHVSLVKGSTRTPGYLIYAIPHRRACNVFGHVSVWQNTWQSHREFHVTLNIGDGFRTPKALFVTRRECATYYRIDLNNTSIAGYTTVQFARERDTAHMKTMCTRGAVSYHVLQVCHRYADAFIRYLCTFSTIVAWPTGGTTVYGGSERPILGLSLMTRNPKTAKSMRISGHSRTSRTRRVPRRLQTSPGSSSMNDKFHVSFHDILRDIASNFSSAETFLPSKVLVRGASKERQNDKLYDGRCMLAKGSLAVDPRQFLFISMTKTITFWLPFEQDGPLYTIEVQAERWDEQSVFDCLFRPPTKRVDDDQVCYNGGSLQRYRMVWTAGRLKAVKNPESYHDSTPPAAGAFTHMADMFAAYITSINRLLC